MACSQHDGGAQHIEEGAIEVQEEILQMHAGVHLPFEGCLVVHRRQAGHGDAAKGEGNGRRRHKGIPIRLPAVTGSCQAPFLCLQLHVTAGPQTGLILAGCQGAILEMVQALERLDLASCRPLL